MFAENLPFMKFDQVFELTQAKFFEFYLPKPVKSIWLLNCTLSNHDIKHPQYLHIAIRSSVNNERNRFDLQEIIRTIRRPGFGNCRAQW
jgi:hypothetical protein